MQSIEENAAIKRMEKWKISAVFEKEFETGKWIEEIPYISFPKSWSIQIIPNFC
jgi:hypothetical protein